MPSEILKKKTFEPLGIMSLGAEIKKIPWKGESQSTASEEVEKSGWIRVGKYSP